MQDESMEKKLLERLNSASAKTAELDSFRKSIKDALDGIASCNCDPKLKYDLLVSFQEYAIDRLDEVVHSSRVESKTTKFWTKP